MLTGFGHTTFATTVLHLPEVVHEGETHDVYVTAHVDQTYHMEVNDPVPSSTPTHASNYGGVSGHDLKRSYFVKVRLK
jgi:hypothetical protein